MVSTPAQKEIRNSSKNWVLTMVISSILFSNELWREMAVDRSHREVLGLRFQLALNPSAKMSPTDSEVVEER